MGLEEFLHRRGCEVTKFYGGRFIPIPVKLLSSQFTFLMISSKEIHFFVFML